MAGEMKINPGLQPGVEEDKKIFFIIFYVLFCLSKKVPKKDIPGQGLRSDSGISY